MSDRPRASRTHRFDLPARAAAVPAAARRRWLGAASGVGLGLLAGAPAVRAQGDAYPSRPVRFVVAFPAGSATDQVARLVAAPMSKAVGQPVIVENRGGANGFLACEAVAKAPPDGYTVLMTTGTTHAANPSLFRKLPYDPVRDFAPVTSMSLSQFVLVATPSLAARNATELAQLARASPGRISFASGNAPSRIGGEMFRMMSGADLLHVPYRGAPQALTDLVGGQVSVMWTDVRTGVPLVQSGKLRALATTGRQRLRTLPDVPTMIEQGFPDYELFNWTGAYVPAGTPPAVVARLNALIHAAVRADQANHETSGGEVVLLAPEEFARLQARDAAMWARVVKAAGIEPE